MEIRNNVDMLFEKYGDHIKSDQHLLLLYWQICDGIEMDKKSISTADWLNNSTHPSDIINAKYLKQAVENRVFY